MRQRVICLAAIGLFLLTAVEAKSQMRMVRLLLNQNAIEAVGADYEINAFGLIGGDKLLTPNGDRLELSNRYSIEGLTFAQFQSNYTGRWTIENNAMGTTENHIFDVHSFDLMGIFSESPFVVEPTNPTLN